MLNRTISTLSANLDRLNLDTRSVVAKATLLNVNGLTLRGRYAHPQASHHFAERDGGIGGDERFSIRRSPMSMPPISPPSPWRSAWIASQGSKVVVAEAPPTVVPVVPAGTRRDDRLGRAQAPGQQDQPRRDRGPDDRLALSKLKGLGWGRSSQAGRCRGQAAPLSRFAGRSPLADARVVHAFDPAAARRVRASGG